MDDGAYSMERSERFLMCKTTTRTTFSRGDSKHLCSFVYNGLADGTTMINRHETPTHERMMLAVVKFRNVQRSRTAFVQEKRSEKRCAQVL